MTSCQAHSTRLSESISLSGCPRAEIVRMEDPQDPQDPRGAGSVEVAAQRSLESCSNSTVAKSEVTHLVL